VRGKCTTRLDVYILKEKCLDQREERKAVALFLCRRREKREKREKSEGRFKDKRDFLFIMYIVDSR
jgi:hypothetical protein